MLSYWNAMMRFADFDGRSSRSEFWLYMLFAAILIGAARYAQLTWHTSVPIGDLVALAHAISSTTAQIRRLHDAGRTGYWLWLGFTVVGVIPILYWLCQPSAGSAPRDRRDDLTPDRDFSRSEPLLFAAGDLGQVRGAVGGDRAPMAMKVASAGTSQAQQGSSNRLILGIATAGALVVLLAIWGKADIVRAIDIIQASFRPTASGPAEVAAALQERQLDKTVVFTGSNDDGILNGITISAVAACMGRKASGRPDGSGMIAFYDDGGSYRLIGADQTGRPLTVSFALALPHIARIEQVATDQRSSDDPGTIAGTLTWLLLGCVAKT